MGMSMRPANMARRRGEPLASRVVLDEPRDGVWPSDHFGVYAELRATPFTPEPL